MTTARSSETSFARRASALLLGLTVAGVLEWAVMSFPTTAPGLIGPSLEQLEKSGVSNPVTAAVLNYRGYDTLLEIGVLLLAVLGVWSVAKADRPTDVLPANPVLLAFLRLVLPVMLFIAGYLLWIGAFAPGGAFQAGAVLGGAILLWLLADGGRTRLPSEAWLRGLLALGLVVFIAVGTGVMAAGGTLLEYPPAHAATLILVIESAALISIALTLAALFLGGKPREDSAPAEPSARRRPTR